MRPIRAIISLPTYFSLLVYVYLYIYIYTYTHIHYYHVASRILGELPLLSEQLVVVQMEHPMGSGIFSAPNTCGSTCQS